MRGDIEMPAGKLAAQVAHVARLCLLRKLKTEPALAETFLNANCCGTMVVLLAKSDGYVRLIAAEAAAQGIPVALFDDSGHVLAPHFDGSAILTGMAMGPGPREPMRALAKKFKCKRA